MAVDPKIREEFIQSVVALLSHNPEANVMVIVDGPDGLKTMCTVAGMAWPFGVLALTEKMFDERFRSALDSEASARTERQLDKQFSAAKRVPGKVN
jgi:hypothetical protein